jgi:hypothetical protein
VDDLGDFLHFFDVFNGEPEKTYRKSLDAGLLCAACREGNKKSPPTSRKGQFLAHRNWHLPSDLSASE